MRTSRICRLPALSLLFFVPLLFSSMTSSAAANGSGRLGFRLSVSGQVDYKVYRNYHPNANHGTFQVNDLPIGSNVLTAYVYFDASMDCRSYGGVKEFRFAGVPNARSRIGRQCSYWGVGRGVYRSDVTALVPGNGSYFYEVIPASYQGWKSFKAAALLIVYEDPSLVPDYQIEIHDGMNCNTRYWEPGPLANPTTFTGFVVDGVPAPEVEAGYIVLGHVGPPYGGWQESHLFNGVTIADNLIGDSLYHHRFDVSHLVTTGATSAVANMALWGDGLYWWVAILRVRTSPAITDTTPPELTIVSHEEDAVVADSPTIVRAAVRDDSGTAISSNPPLDWNPTNIPPETMSETWAEFYLAEGPNPITVTATDDVGLFSSASVTITLDTHVPEVVITEPEGDTVFAVPLITLRGTVLDATETHVTSTPEGVIDAIVPAGGGEVSGSPVLVEGENELSLNATDRAGHTGGDSVTVILDTIPPTVTITTPAQGAVLGLAPATLTIEVLDATETTVAFGEHTAVLGPGGGTASGDVDLVEGWNAVVVSVTDAAGNATEVVLDLLLDLSAPVVTIDTPVTGAIFGPGESPIPVIATVDDLSATEVESTPPGVAGAVPQGGGVIPGAVTLVEGHNSIEVRATDETDRTGSDSVAVILDTTPPDVALTAPADGDAVRGTIDFHATATDVEPGSGVAAVELLLDGAPYAPFGIPPYETTVDTTDLVDGTHAFGAEAADGVGNVGSASVFALVDNNPPTVEVTAPLEGEVLNGQVDFLATLDDAGSLLAAVEMRVATEPPNLLDDSRVFDPPLPESEYCVGRDDTSARSDGPVVYSVRVIDDAGNEATDSVTVTLDNTPPEWTLLQPADGSVVSGTIEIVAAAEDANLDTLEIRVDGVSKGNSGSSPFSVLYDTATRLDGAMTVTVVATDLAGNLSTCSANVTVDNVAVEVAPHSLNLKSKGKAHSITATLEGTSVGLLLPVELSAVELRVPGGNAVPATAGFAGDDVLTDADGDGVLELHCKFDRQLLIASIQAALDAELVDPKAVPVTLCSQGFEIGTGLVKVVGSK